MTSILTNTSAMSAVSALATTQRYLARTQNEISSGLKVATAKDNAAYWSIATSMKTRVGEMQAINDGLDVTKGIIGTTNAALTTIVGLTQGISKDLITAQTSGADLSKVQLDIASKQQQIISVAQSANYNGINWLVTKVTGHFLDTSTVNADTTLDNFLKSKGNFTTSFNNHQETDFTLTLGSTSSGTSSDNEQSSSNGTSHGPLPTMSSSVTGDPTGYRHLELGLGIGADGSVSKVDVDLHNTELFKTFTGSYTTDQTVTGTDGTEDFSSSGTNVTKTPFIISFGSFQRFGAFTSDEILDSVFSVNVTPVQDSPMTATHLNLMSDIVDVALKGLASAQAYMGGLENEIDGTQSLNRTIIDALTSGIGSLVDADMNEDSTRLLALQTQQSLGVQALGIANDNSQVIMKLFGG